MKSDFKRRPNYSVAVFLMGYVAYTAYYLFVNLMTDMVSCITLLIACIIFLVYFLGFRDCGYTVTAKTVYTHRRLLKDKELDLMQCANITDPVVKLTRWTSMPHSIEIYTDANKRYAFFPTDRINFTGAVLRENKRIHCTVKEYTDMYRKVAKQQRKERRNARNNNSRNNDNRTKRIESNS